MNLSKNWVFDDLYKFSIIILIILKIESLSNCCLNWILEIEEEIYYFNILYLNIISLVFEEKWIDEICEKFDLMWIWWLMILWEL